VTRALLQVLRISRPKCTRICGGAIFLDISRIFQNFIMCINWFIRSLQFALHVRVVVLYIGDIYIFFYIYLNYICVVVGSDTRTPAHHHNRKHQTQTHGHREWIFSSGGSSAYDGVSKTKFIHFPTARRCLKIFKICWNVYVLEKL